LSNYFDLLLLLILLLLSGPQGNGQPWGQKVKGQGYRRTKIWSFGRLVKALFSTPWSPFYSRLTRPSHSGHQS